MYASAAALEAALGDPWRDGSAMSFRASLEDDEAERFPDAACAALDAFGLPGYYVPAAVGGSLTTYDELMQLVRLVARRDLTAIIGHAKTYLGAAGVWVAGSLARRQRVPERGHGPLGTPDTRRRRARPTHRRRAPQPAPGQRVA